MYLNPFGLTYLFHFFSYTLYVRDHNGDVSLVVVAVVCRAAGVVVLLDGLVVSAEFVL